MWADKLERTWQGFTSSLKRHTEKWEASENMENATYDEQHQRADSSQPFSIFSPRTAGFEINLPGRGTGTLVLGGHSHFEFQCHLSQWPTMKGLPITNSPLGCTLSSSASLRTSVRKQLTILMVEQVLFLPCDKGWYKPRLVCQSVQ